MSTPFVIAFDLKRCCHMLFTIAFSTLHFQSNYVGYWTLDDTSKVTSETQRYAVNTYEYCLWQQGFKNVAVKFTMNNNNNNLHFRKILENKTIIWSWLAPLWRSGAWVFWGSLKKGRGWEVRNRKQRIWKHRMCKNSIWRSYWNYIIIMLQYERLLNMSWLGNHFTLPTFS